MTTNKKLLPESTFSEILALIEHFEKKHSNSVTPLQEPPDHPMAALPSSTRKVKTGFGGWWGYRTTNGIEAGAVFMSYPPELFPERKTPVPSLGFWLSARNMLNGSSRRGGERDLARNFGALVEKSKSPSCTGQLCANVFQALKEGEYPLTTGNG